MLSLASLVLTLAAPLGLGRYAAARASSSQVAQALTLLLFYPVMVLSGIYAPVQEIHSGLIPLIANPLPGRGRIQRAARVVRRTVVRASARLLVLAAWAIG